MKIITNYHLFNVVGNTIIQFFNKYLKIKNSPLPTSAYITREFVDNTKIPYLEFKETTVVLMQGIVFKLYYQSIIQSIASLLAINDINQKLVLDFHSKQFETETGLHQVYEEQFNCNWWK